MGGLAGTEGYAEAGSEVVGSNGSGIECRVSGAADRSGGSEIFQDIQVKGDDGASYCARFCYLLAVVIRSDDVR